jgi:hypothetical protein
MIRTKGEAGTGDVVEAVRHARAVLGEIRRLQTMPDDELMAYSKEIGAPYELVVETRNLGRLPVVNFAAGGLATPADAALMMQLGVTASSSDRASSSLAIPPAEPRPSSKLRRITTTRRSWPKSAAAWASRWSASA